MFQPHVLGLVAGQGLRIINGDDETYWLGAGNAGTNGVHSGPWTGLCNNVQTSWDCSTGLPGKTDTTHIEWTLGFSKVPPGITPPPRSSRLS